MINLSQWFRWWRKGRSRQLYYSETLPFQIAVSNSSVSKTLIEKTKEKYNNKIVNFCFTFQDLNFLIRSIWRLRCIASQARIWKKKSSDRNRQRSIVVRIGLCYALCYVKHYTCNFLSVSQDPIAPQRSTKILRAFVLVDKLSEIRPQRHYRL